MELSKQPAAAGDAAPAADGEPATLKALRQRHRHVQSHIADSVHAALLGAHVDTIRDDRRAFEQHRSQSGEVGTAWLDAPSSGPTAVDTELARIAFLDAHALPLPEAAGLACPSCNVALDPATAILHLGGACDKHKTARHRALGRALILIISALAGVEYIVAEPRGIYDNPAVPDARPDFVFGPVTGAPAPYDSKQSVVDHTVVSSLSATRLAAAAKEEPGAAAAAAHNKKVASCTPFLDATRYTFVPFAVEAHGRLHPDALAFLRMLATTVAQQKLSSTVHPTDSDVAARTVNLMAGQLLTSWLRLISTVLVTVRANRVLVMLAKARGRANGHRPVRKGRGAYAYAHISLPSVRRLLLDSRRGSLRSRWLD